MYYSAWDCQLNQFKEIGRMFEVEIHKHKQLILEGN